MILGKSKLIQGFQCEKSLWLSFNHQEPVPPIASATQKQIAERDEVGQKAREWWGNGRLIDVDIKNMDQACVLTKNAINEGETTIFEASFLASGLYARVDILNRKAPSSGWELIEVKKTTTAKSYHIQDVAIQAIVLKKAGIVAKSYHLMHLNSECVFPDLKNLFVVVDISKEVKALIPEIEDRILEIQSVVKSPAEPKRKIGPHCEDPFQCSFKAYCWKHIPEKNVFDLPRIGKKAWDLLDNGVVKISDLSPDDYSGVTSKAIQASKANKRLIDSEGIKSSLRSFEWPLYFLDFETISPPIPRYDGAGPYTQVPFQVSCHIWVDKHTSELMHFEFLHIDASDPRPGIIATLLKHIGQTGSIVAYNQGFEVGVISRLAEFDKINEKSLMAFTTRFVDPLPIFRRHVYDPKFRSSFSIKSVAPAILGEKHSYRHLQVQDGGQAQGIAESLMKGVVPAAGRENTIAALLEYCRQDTYLMVELVRWLFGQVNNKGGKSA